MAREWLTLTQAAEQLGISTRTLRRWIHDGKLRAELRPGPYGQQYLVPTGELSALQVARDVERMQREADLATLSALLGSYLSEREEDLQQSVTSLQEQVLDVLRQIVQTQESILSELATLREAVARLRADNGPLAPPRLEE
jgi:excisionase family DNA binding protein